MSDVTTLQAQLEAEQQRSRELEARLAELERRDTIPCPRATETMSMRELLVEAVNVSRSNRIELHTLASEVHQTNQTIRDVESGNHEAHETLIRMMQELATDLDDRFKDVAELKTQLRLIHGAACDDCKKRLNVANAFLTGT